MSDISKVTSPDILAGIEGYFEMKKAETIATNTFSPASRSIFSPENLDEKIKLTVPGQNGAILRSRLPRTPGVGQAAAWKRLTSALNTNVGTALPGTNTSIAFADAGAPNETTQTYVTTTAAFKLLGRKLEIGGLAVAASRGRVGSGYENVMAEREATKMVEVMLGEEEMLISGDSSVNPLEFDGISKQITSISGTAPLLTVSGIGNYEKMTYDRGGSGATLLLTNTFQLLALSNQLEHSGSIVRLNAALGTTSHVAGNGMITGIVSPITGQVIDVKASRYTGGTGLLLTEKDPQGEAWIEIEELIPMSRVDVNSQNFSQISFIVEAEVVKVIGEPFQVKLAGLATQ